MINRINFLGHIADNCGPQVKINTKKNTDSDSFALSREAKKEMAVNKARKKIIEEIKKSGCEYGFIISQNGEILQEARGDEDSCNFDKRNIRANCIMLHGHPNPLPLSSGDIASLLITDAISEEAVMENGCYSRLTKKAPVVIDESFSKLYLDLETELCLMALDKLNIDYKLNKDDISKIGREFLDYTCVPNAKDLNNEEVFQHLQAKGIDTNRPLEEIQNQLKKRLFLKLIATPEKYNKEYNTIRENQKKIDDFLKSKEGLNVRNKFVERVADRYNLDYETNLFD